MEILWLHSCSLPRSVFYDPLMRHLYYVSLFWCWQKLARRRCCSSRIWALTWRGSHCRRRLKAQQQPELPHSLTQANHEGKWSWWLLLRSINVFEDILWQIKYGNLIEKSSLQCYDETRWRVWSSLKTTRHLSEYCYFPHMLDTEIYWVVVVFTYHCHSGIGQSQQLLEWYWSIATTACCFFIPILGKDHMLCHYVSCPVVYLFH